MSPEQIITEAIERYKPEKYVLLVSGGHDSVTNAHISAQILQKKDIEFVVYHGNTTIGIPAVRKYVHQICKKYGWSLKVRKPPDRNWWYDKIVERYGFPGPTKTSHQYMYRYLKERALRRFVTYECKSSPYSREHVFLGSGVRQQESIIRMGYSDAIVKDASKIWVSPIFSFSEKNVQDYMKANSIPENPVKKAICISGECLCGCFTNKEEWAEIQSCYPETAKKINDLWEVARANGYPWHWASGPTEWKKERDREKLPKQQMFNFLCVGCEMRYENPELINPQ